MVKPTVFVDSSVLITALLSSTGGSFCILTQCRGLFTFQINEYVLAETQEILRTKFAKRPSITTHLFLLLGIADVVVLPDPAKRDLLTAAKVISENDAPILSCALEWSDYLVTLDNEFLTDRVIAKAREKSLTIMKPKEFLEQIRKPLAA
jgi:predicted nucleic acid-binding protein